MSTISGTTQTTEDETMCEKISVLPYSDFDLHWCDNLAIVEEIAQTTEQTAPIHATELRFGNGDSVLCPNCCRSSGNDEMNVETSSDSSRH